MNESRLVKTFLDLVQVDSPTGHESRMAEILVKRLRELGLDVRQDETGNIIATLDGEGEPVLLSAHMDTVEPGRGIRPQVKDGIITSDGTTVLGSDDKSGIAVILEVLQRLQESGERHVPLEVVLTVSEEGGLVGAKALDTGQLRSKRGLVLDSGGPIGTIVRQAPSQDSIYFVVHGKASHAGAEPEKGINAILVASEAITQMPLGRIDEETTANIGKIAGGRATNIVPDKVEMWGEARSLSNDKLAAQTRRMTQAVESAAAKHGARAEVKITRAYETYRLADSHPWIQHLISVCEKIGVAPLLKSSGGGSDANIFNSKGIETAVVSTGMTKVHTTEEYIAIADMSAAAEFVHKAVTY